MDADFDISQYELEDTCLLTLKNARGDDDLTGNDGKPVVVEIYSPGSGPGVKALQKAGRAAQLRMMRTFRGEIDRHDAENAEREQARKLVEFTKSISANFPVPAEAFYSNPKLCYLKAQVEKCIGDTANFSKGSSPS